MGVEPAPARFSSLNWKEMPNVPFVEGGGGGGGGGGQVHFLTSSLLCYLL